MRTIKTVCPLCDEEINTVTPEGRETGRFFIKCPQCKKDVCLTLSKGDQGKAKGISESLVVVEEDANTVELKRKDIGRHSEKPIGKNVLFFRRNKAGRKAVVMEEGVKCVPLTMEMKAGDEQRKSDKLTFHKKENPTNNKRMIARKGDSRRGKPISSIDKREAARKGYRRASMGLFFVTFILGLLFFVTLPLQPTLMTDSIGNSGDGSVDIMGRVFSGEDDGSVVSGADVTIDELNRKTSTNKEGYFFFKNLPYGTYTFTARKKSVGSATATSSGTIINLQLSTDSNDMSHDNTISATEEDSFNSVYTMSILASFSSLAAVIAIQFSRKFYLTIVFGIIGIASIGFFIGSFCAMVGVVLFIYSKNGE